MSCKLCLDQNNINDTDIIYSDEYWLVKHSQETNILGYLILQSKRHFLDLSEANQKELSTYGPLLGKLMSALKKTISPNRIYTFTLAEVVPHFHVHIIPATLSLPKAFRGRGIVNYPLEPKVSTALKENMVASILRKLKTQELP
jgi:diadenosine tetraphosphate (Ap4A) HIT family hydrolase